MQALVSRMAPTRLTSFAEKLKKVALLLACDRLRQLCLVLCECANVRDYVIPKDVVNVLTRLLLCSDIWHRLYLGRPQGWRSPGAHRWQRCRLG